MHSCRLEEALGRTMLHQRSARGDDQQPESMFSYVSLDERVPADHPLRAIQRITETRFEMLRGTTADVDAMPFN